MPGFIRHTAYLLGILAIAGCMGLPKLHGVRSSSRHYTIDTDSHKPGFALEVAGLSEKFHGLLSVYFGNSKTPRIPLFVFTDWRNFQAHTWTERSYGEYISHPWYVNAISAMTHELDIARRFPFHTATSYSAGAGK